MMLLTESLIWEKNFFIKMMLFCFKKKAQIKTSCIDYKIIIN